MKRLARWILLLVLILVIAILNGYVSWNGASVSQKRINAAPVPLVGLDRKILHLDLKGKTRLLVFWATWCEPCRAEIPDLSSYQRRYASRGFEVDAFSLDEGGPSVVKSFVKAFRIPYPVYLATQESVKEFGGVDSIPVGFLINSKGEIVKRYDGLQDPKTVSRDIESLL